MILGRAHCCSTSKRAKEWIITEAQTRIRSARVSYNGPVQYTWFMLERGVGTSAYEIKPNDQPKKKQQYKGSIYTAYSQLLTDSIPTDSSSDMAKDTGLASQWYVYDSEAVHESSHGKKEMTDGPHDLAPQLWPALHTAFRQDHITVSYKTDKLNSRRRHRTLHGYVSESDFDQTTIRV